VNKRKNEHIKLALDQQQSNVSSFLQYTFTHNALPEIDYNDINVATSFLGKNLTLPLIVSSMTGGTKLADKINEQLAQLCKSCGIGMGVGSQRNALESESSQQPSPLRKIAPTILLLANVGAVQLNYGFTWKHIQKAIDMIDADGVFLHLNPLQEIIQPEGNRNFATLLPKIKTIIDKVTKPVLIKEVGNGISNDVATRLANAGIHYIATEGKGGTNWAIIEGQRAKNALGHTFQHWGISTTESILACKQIKGMHVIAGGGVTTGLDIAKAIALGADIASMGRPILTALMDSYEKAQQCIATLEKELKITLFCLGLKNIDELKKKGEKLLKKTTEYSDF